MQPADGGPRPGSPHRRGRGHSSAQQIHSGRLQQGSWIPYPRVLPRGTLKSVPPAQPLTSSRIAWAPPSCPASATLPPPPGLNIRPAAQPRLSRAWLHPFWDCILGAQDPPYPPFFCLSLFKQSLHPTWSLGSQPGGQESHAFPAEPSQDAPALGTLEGEDARLALPSTTPPGKLYANTENTHPSDVQQTQALLHTRHP